MKWFITALALAVSTASLPAAAQNAPFAGGAQAGKGIDISGDPKAVKMEAAVAKLEKELKAKPKDAKLKAELVKSSYTLGSYLMKDSPLGPRVKYRGALKYFNKALALDPKHKEAAADKKTIEDIYKQMGMPVPKVD
jgi:tetratricopeptide (TPR) repeat protein